MSKTPQAHCWSCQASVTKTDLFCSGCDVILPPSQQDHFARLSLEKSFNLKRKQLEKQYLVLQSQLHPDRFIVKSDQQKMIAMQHTMSLNEAYEVLKSDLLRAEYLLELEGIIVNKEQTENSVKPSQTLLMESLEAREGLSEYKDKAALDRFVTQTQSAIKESIATIDGYFTTNQFMDAAHETIRLKYLYKLLEECKQKGRG